MADQSSWLQNLAQQIQRGGASEVTASGVPVAPALGRPAGAGDLSWQDQAFAFLSGAGSAVLQHELAKDTFQTINATQAQYGQLYASPGSFFPSATGQGPGVAVGGFSVNPVLLLLLAAAGVVAFVVLKD